jgi:antitoxin HicB
MTTKKGLLTKSKKTTDISKKTPDEYLKESYARIIIPEENGTFSAEVLEFPGCFSQGDTPDEAFRNLEEAAKSWIEAVLAQGQEVPPPSANQGYGGKIALRLPRSLHRLAVRKAERDHISLNQCLVTAIASWVGADDLYTRYAERVRQVPMLTVNASAHLEIVHNIYPQPGFPNEIAQKAGTIGPLEGMTNPQASSSATGIKGLEVQNG